ncbi:MAG: hypothetical protein EZS28_034020, partial [Streblomastix strix]
FLIRLQVNRRTMMKWGVEVKWEDLDINFDVLKQKFTPFDVIDVIMRGQQHESNKFCAFVTFPTQEAASEAVKQVDGIVIDQRVLDVQVPQQIEQILNIGLLHFSGSQKGQDMNKRSQKREKTSEDELFRFVEDLSKIIITQFKKNKHDLKLINVMAPLLGVKHVGIQQVSLGIIFNIVCGCCTKAAKFKLQQKQDSAEESYESVLNQDKWRERHSHSEEIKNRFEQSGVIHQIYQLGVQRKELSIKEKSAVIIGQIYQGEALPEYLRSDVIDILKNYIAFHKIIDHMFSHYFHVLADLAWNQENHLIILSGNFLSIINQHLQSPKPKNVQFSLELIVHLMLNGNDATKDIVKKGIDFNLIKTCQISDRRGYFLLVEILKADGFLIENVYDKGKNEQKLTVEDEDEDEQEIGEDTNDDGGEEQGKQDKEQKQEKQNESQQKEKKEERKGE